MRDDTSHREAIELDEGIPATLVPVKGFGYATGYRIGLKPVIRYPVKHSNWLDAWSDDHFEFADLNFRERMPNA